MSEKPWFVRIRTPFRYRIMPYSAPGWIATAVYVLGVIALGATRHLGQDPRTAWWRWLMLFAVWTIGYIVLAIRMSVGADGVIKRSRD